MSTPADHDLLREYACNRAEAAFTLLVQRHLNLVYSVALRRTGDVELARDCCQLVFMDLARKAGRLRRNTVLTGWLHRAAYFAANRLMRSEIRRERREEAAMNNEPIAPAEVGWNDLMPLLDEAIQKLAGMDRQAVILRFLENRSHQEVAFALGITEDAARKRVNRAIERIRKWLWRRGVHASAVGLTTLLSTHAIQIAPAGLVAPLTTTATSAAVSLPILNQMLGTMTTTQIKTGIATLAVASLAIPVVLQQRTISELQAENLQLKASSTPPLASENILPDAAQPMGVVADKPTPVQLDRSELMRLRGQIGVLHSQLAEAAEDRAQLADALAKAQDKLTNSLISSWTLTREDWQNKGLAEPLDAFETMLWAWNTGDHASLERAVRFPEGVDSSEHRERFLRSILPREQQSVTRTERINVFYHAGDEEQTHRTIVAHERYVFIARPIEYRENLVAWELHNLGGEWKVVSKRYLN